MGWEMDSPLMGVWDPLSSVGAAVRAEVELVVLESLKFSIGRAMGLDAMTSVLFSGNFTVDFHE